MQGYAQDTTKAGSNSAPATGENLQAAARDHGGPISGADMAARGATNAAAAATKVPGSSVIPLVDNPLNCMQIVPPRDPHVQEQHPRPCDPACGPQTPLAAMHHGRCQGREDTQ